MLRKLLLATSTLGVILVLFAVYHLSTGGSAGSADDPVQEILAHAEMPMPEAPASQPAQERPEIRGIPLGEGGKKAWVTWYDKKTRKAKIQFRATTWEPVSDTEFHLVDLEVRMMMPGGQIAEVQAREGQILVSPGDLSEASIRRGRIQGDVQIRIDRTTPQWRRQNPDLRDMAQHPEKVVRLWMDELNFDLELSRLQTESQFRMQSAEVDLRGRGLLLRWNEDEDRIDYLEITQGEQLSVTGFQSSVDFTMLGGEEQLDEDAAPSTLAASDRSASEAAPEAPEPTREATRTETEEPRADPDVLDLGILKKEKPRVPVTYLARFSGNVEAAQLRGPELVGKLEADSLALLFDAGQLEAVAAANDRSGETTDPETKTAPVSDRDRSKLTLTWNGPLIVEPQPSTADEHHIRRLQIEASGNPVRLRDKQGSATCDKLIYHKEAGRLWMHGGPDAPVYIVSGPGRSMRTEALFYDRREKIARFTGRGEIKAGNTQLLTDRPAQEPAVPDPESSDVTVIRWSNSVEFELAQAEFRVHDPETGKDRTVKNPWIKRGVLDGDVTLAQENQVGRGSHMEIDFAVPLKPKRLIGHVRHFEGRGEVQLLSGRDDIRCDRMTIDMTTAPDGRNVPVQAFAEGRVTARQDSRIIQAEESMAVTMREIPRPQADIDIQQAKRLAKSRGIDPEKVDWEAWARKRAARTETAIVSLKALGEVRVNDSERRLHLRADQLDCTFPDGRKIDRATVVAHQGRLADVQTEDFAITGQRIELITSETWALVPGPGEVEFYSDQDLDGKKLERPLPVVVSWEGQMEMRGDANQLRFEQRVRATGTDRGQERYTLDCDRLSINFIDLPNAQAIPTATEQLSRYWILEPLIRRSSGRNSESSSPFGEGARRTEFRKKPVLMMADGNVVALFSGFAGGAGALQSRMRIAGPKLAVDLRKQTTNVEGTGNLLIEDYRVPSSADRRKPAAKRESDPLLGSLVGGGPSQTLFTWKNSMSFLMQRNVAIFDQNVHMTHRAGADLVLGKRVAAARNLDITDLRRLKGRKTTLDCDNLLVEFRRGLGDGSDQFMGGARSADLRLIEATGLVTLKDTTKTLVGHRLSYLRDSGLVTLHARRGHEAHIYDEDGKTGVLRAHWRGPVLRWNLNNNHIEASQSTILLGRR